jgi:hypothetical protein
VFLHAPADFVESWYHIAMKHQDPRVKVRTATRARDERVVEGPSSRAGIQIKYAVHDA